MAIAPQNAPCDDSSWARLSSGTFEIDDTYFGGPEEGHFGRKAEKKVLIVIAVELCGKSPSRVRLHQVYNARSTCLFPFVTEVVVPEATTSTDEWSGYSGLKELGSDHQIVNITKS